MTQEEKERPYLTALEVGELVRLSDKSVYRLRKVDKTFPCVKVGGTWRFPRDRVLRWLAQRTQGR